MEPIELIELTAGAFRLRPWRPDDVDAVRRAFRTRTCGCGTAAESSPGRTRWSSSRYGDGVKHDELLWARLADDPAPELSSRS